MVALTESGCAQKTTEIQTLVQEGKHHKGLGLDELSPQMDGKSLDFGSSKTPSTAIKFKLNELNVFV